MTFLGKNSVLTPEILMSFFSHRPYFVCLLPVSTVLNLIYNVCIWPFPSPIISNFTQKCPRHTFFVSIPLSHSRRAPPSSSSSVFVLFYAATLYSFVVPIHRTTLFIFGFRTCWLYLFVTWIYLYGLYMPVFSLASLWRLCVEPTVTLMLLCHA